ncbi:MAG: T9SS type A sorting domain-containing protein [Bacteroidota bacterium]
MRLFALLATALLFAPAQAQVLDYAQQTPYPIVGGPSRPMMALDGDENVYLAGKLIGTTDFDMSDGVAELAYDPTATPYPTSGEAAFVAKYAADGTYEWAFGLSLDDIAFNLRINGLAVDAAGNITVVGDMEVRVEQEGDERVYRPIDFDPGPGVASLGVFSNENPSLGTEPSNFVASYDADGNFRWAFELTKARTVADIFTVFLKGARLFDVTTDADGNVYVAGEIDGFNPLFDAAEPVNVDPRGGNTSVEETGAFLAKYTPEGTLLWATATSPGASDVEGRADARFERVAVDAAGRAFVAGTFGLGPVNVGGIELGSEANVFLTSGLLAQYDADGSAANWAFPLEDAADQQADFIHSMLRPSPDGGVFWTGYLRQAADFDPGPGQTIITAQTYPNGTSFDDAFAAHYTGDGTLGWVRQISGVYNQEVLDYYAEATADGRTFVVGNGTNLERLDPPSDRDFGDTVEIILIEYDLATGTQQNLYLDEAEPPVNEDYTRVDVWDMEIAPSGQLYLLGNVSDSNSSIPFDFDFGAETTTLPIVESAMFLARYDATVRPVNAEDDATPTAFTLGVPYPNPARDAVTLTLALAQAQHVRVEVFDLLGRRVQTLHDGPLPATSHRFTLDGARLPSGTYVVRVAGSEQVRTTRFALTR